MRIPALRLIPLLFTPAIAAETPWQEIAPGAKVRLVSSDVLKPDGTTMVALEIDMPEATNTYWRVPGETGIPTEFDFTASSGVTGHEVLWPFPLIETKTGYVDFVYRGPTVLPVELKLDGKTADIRLGIVMGVCSDICVPVTATFQLPLSLRRCRGATHAIRLPGLVSTILPTPSQCGSTMPKSTRCRSSPIPVRPGNSLVRRKKARMEN